MGNIRNILYFFLTFLFLFYTSISAKSDFPNKWFGKWSGKATSLSAGSQEQYSMTLTIAPIRNSKNIRWIIQYEGEPSRNYKMIPIKSKKGHYILDENNGIVIEHYYQDGSLFSQFAINGMSFSSRLTLEEGQLREETFSYYLEDPKKSGGSSTPQVYSYSFKSCITALLKLEK